MGGGGGWGWDGLFGGAGRLEGGGGGGVAWCNAVRWKGRRWHLGGGVAGEEESVPVDPNRSMSSVGDASIDCLHLDELKGVQCSVLL